MRLLAPSALAAVLLGPGKAQVEEVLAWEGPAIATLLAGEPAPGRLGATLGAADVVVAFTRSEPLLAALRRRAARVLAHDPAPPPDGPHASLWLGRALEPLGLAATADPPPLEWMDADRRDALDRAPGLRPGLLALHPGSGSPAKNWPAMRFVEVARRLAGGQPFLLASGPAEAEAPPLAGAVLARSWPVRSLGVTLSRAGLFVGNDSGVTHLAAAAGAPTLALFGPTDPATWAPVGPRVATLRAPGGMLAHLGVDEVVEAAIRLRARCAASGPPSG